MKTSNIQLLAIASIFSCAFASPVPGKPRELPSYRMQYTDYFQVEITPVAEYLDETVADLESEIGAAIDALGLEARQPAEITPIAEYLDETVADLESEIGGALDALGLEGPAKHD